MGTLIGDNVIGDNTMGTITTGSVTMTLPNCILPISSERPVGKALHWGVLSAGDLVCMSSGLSLSIQSPQPIAGVAWRRSPSGARLPVHDDHKRSVKS